ncbi:MAG TPA: XdhC/CoxI family protein [Acidothermaceae bacterium]|nr:XdhC/CoxI family protein [Acidothermaceae bacterium]
MKEILGDVEQWRRQGRRVALARVIDVEGSGPRQPGAAMAVSEDGEVAGSVSGGCVEGAVMEAALESLASGERGLLTFGYSDADAFAVGLTCGGTVHLYVEPLDWAPNVQHVLLAALREDAPIALATVVAGKGVGSKLLYRPGEPLIGSLGTAELDVVAARDAAGELAAGSSRLRHYGERGQIGRDEVSVFIESFVAPARMIIFGAVDFTAALVRTARVMGFRVTVCDARPAFATNARFPLADEVVVDWPDRYLRGLTDALTSRDAVCVLTHDSKFDVPAIVAALDTEVGYLGALGSRRTHADRLARLREVGVSEGALDRLHAPIGLDLGARTPEETAISICAEIISVRTGRNDIRPLTDTERPIHDSLVGTTAMGGVGTTAMGGVGATALTRTV